MPTLIRWPGVIEPGTVINDIAAHEDMLTTLLAAAGEPGIKEELLTGKQVGDRTYKVHLDGYDLLPALKGEGPWPRREFLYWTDDGSVAALRYDDWKVTFLRQNAVGLGVWQEPFEELRAPALANLRMDPFERAEEEDAMGYQRWFLERMFLIAPAASLRRRMAAELPRVPAAAEAGQLQPRAGDGGGDRSFARRTVTPEPAPIRRPGGSPRPGSAAQGVTGAARPLRSRGGRAAKLTKAASLSASRTGVGDEDRVGGRGGAEAGGEVDDAAEHGEVEAVAGADGAHDHLAAAMPTPTCRFHSGCDLEQVRRARLLDLEAARHGVAAPCRGPGRRRPPRRR